MYALFCHFSLFVRFIKMNNGKNDLTEGSIGRKLISFFLPIAAGTLFQQLYNAADAIVVGKFVGTIALAAVGGSAAHITNLLIGFFVALSGGSTVVIAQLFGAKDEESIQKATGTAIAFCIISGIVLTIVGFAFTPVFLRVLQSPPDTIAESTTYLRIVFLGVTAQLLYNMEAGVLNAVGDSRSPFIYLSICCIVNIFLDLLLVAIFKMGVAGAAIATIASQILSAVLATAKLMRSKEAYRITLKGIGLHRKLLGRMLHIGIPAGLQSSMYAISNMIIQVAVNLLGTATVAAWSLSGKIDGFYWACSNAAGIAVMNFAAQNYGAGRMDRVHDCEKLSLKLFMGVTLLFSALLLGVGRSVLPVFNDDAEVLAKTWQVMLYMVPLYFTWTYIEIISGVLRGIGDAVVPVIIIGVGVCLLRVVWIATVYRSHPTMLNVCLAYPISWIVTDVAFFFYYRRVKWLYHIK